MTEMTVPLVSKGNGRWGSPSPAWDHLIDRESSGIPDIVQSPSVVDVNTGGNEAEGLFQITPKTWLRNGGTQFASSARRATPQQQAMVAARIFTRNPTGSDWGAGRPGREDPRQLAAGLVPLDPNQQESTVPDNSPAFNEIEQWSPSSSSRNGTKVDAIFLHTSEGVRGDNAARDLTNFLCNPANQVSYHYAASQASDGGVTVYDVVDTDEMSWSVLSANARSINYCFAGSFAAWSTDQWMQQSKAIDVVAYLCVQDCRKYGIPAKVIAPPYSGRIPGISDHRYVTKIIGDGTHTDVGDNFPWSYFDAAVQKYATGKGGTTPPPVPGNGGSTPPPAPAKVWPQSATDRELLEYIAMQLGPGDPSWKSKGATLRDKLWSLGRDAS